MSQSEVTITSLSNGWSLVDYSPEGSGGYSVSVGADGLIYLPRRVTSEQVADFVTAALAAVEVAHAATTKADAKANEPPSQSHGSTPGLQWWPPCSALRVDRVNDSAGYHETCSDPGPD